jgi:phosphatidylglycerol:prolipoprotein diacylglycerol transferase
MNKVYFPGFDLELLIPQTAFNIFGIEVRWYAICIVFGIVLALILCKKSSENFYITFDIVLENTLLALIIGVIGARLYYIIFNLSYYLKNPIEMFNIRNGGLAIYGGLIAGGFTIYKMCKSEHINVLDYFDYIVPFVAIAQAFGRWGNFFNLEAYGAQTTSIFRMGIETAAGYMEVHPVFLYEFIACLVIFIILRFVQKHRKFSGEIFYLYLALYSGIRFFLEELRQDSLLFLGFKISKILSAIIFVVSCMYLLKGFIKKRK